MFQSMSKEQFMESGCLYAGNVDEALRKYKNAMLSADDKWKMHTFIKRACAKNQGRAYADFYYPVLEEKQQKEFVAGLSEWERAALSEFETRKRQVYYSLEDDRMLDFLFGITARNWLFSTFYFADKKAILWGNYNLEFPIFCENEAVLAEYTELARECGLECYI